jgi:hypothetical protein
MGRVIKRKFKLMAMNFSVETCFRFATLGKTGTALLALRGTMPPRMLD